MTRQEMEPEKLPDTTVVVVDVFLATTTLLTILENGARNVFPVASLEEAEEVCGGLDERHLLRGGEQGAEKIEGYDLGPYPKEYAPKVVRDKDVVFVTTNGTRAIGAAAGARELLLGCLNEDGYLDDWRLNDAAWLALDFAGRYGGRELEVLREGRAGRWFLENAMAEELEFVGNVGASELVPEVVEGRLRRAVEKDGSPP
jgi:2-phosphosulfolactate phosphatase